MNVQELSEIQRDVLLVTVFPLKVSTVSELLEQRMLCWTEGYVVLVEAVLMKLQRVSEMVDEF